MLGGPNAWEVSRPAGSRADLGCHRTTVGRVRADPAVIVVAVGGVAYGDPPSRPVTAGPAAPLTAPCVPFVACGDWVDRGGVSKC